PRLEFLLDCQTLLPGDAAVMSADIFVAEALSEMTGHTLGHTTCVGKDQSCAMFTDQLGQSIVNFLPNLTAHHGLEGRRQDFNRQVQFSCMPGVDDVAGRNALVRDPSASNQVSSYLFNGTLRGRESDAQQFMAH